MPKTYCTTKLLDVNIFAHFTFAYTHYRNSYWDTMAVFAFYITFLKLHEFLTIVRNSCN